MDHDRSRWSPRTERTSGKLRVAMGATAIMVVVIAAAAARQAETRGPMAEAETETAGILESAASVLDPVNAVVDGVAGAGEVVERVEPAAEPAPIEWASAREPSSVEPVPASERVRKPAAVRGIYVGAWSMGNAERLASLVRLADDTEVNAFVIDVKDVTGEVSYATEVPLAEQVGTTRRLKIGDIRAVLAKLREHDIYPIARIVAFKDPLLAEARPEWSIRRHDGSIWEDNNGVRWVDSFNEDVWAYNIELAREAIALGFSEIQWDYVRFPDAPRSYMEDAFYPARDGRTMSQGIRAFMIRSREELAETGAPLTADVFGITTSAYRDVGIGQLWEDMADVMDVLLPMVYPSHYPRGTWDFPVPNAAPYQIVRKAMRHGVERSKEIENAATIRPWLQAFSLGEPAYTPEYVRAQIDAVYDAGLTEWILWNPSARYSAEALATEDGIEPWFAGRGESLYDPPRADEERDRRRDGPLGSPASTVR